MIGLGDEYLIRSGQRNVFKGTLTLVYHLDKLFVKEPKASFSCFLVFLNYFGYLNPICISYGLEFSEVNFPLSNQLGAYVRADLNWDEVLACYTREKGLLKDYLHVDRAREQKG